MNEAKHVEIFHFYPGLSKLSELSGLRNTCSPETGVGQDKYLKVMNLSHSFIVKSNALDNSLGSWYKVHKHKNEFL